MEFGMTGDTHPASTGREPEGDGMPSAAAWPLHAFLLAPASIFALMANSLNLTSFSDVAPMLAAALAFSLAVYLLVAALRRSFDANTGIVASIWIGGSLFFVGIFGGINSALGGGFPMIRVLPVALFVMTATTFLVQRAQRPLLLVNIVFNAIAVVIVATPLARALAYQWENRAAADAYDAEKAFAEMGELALISPSPATPLPDIYHFVFDRYTSETMLARHFGKDNRDIGNFLEDRGFYLARQSHSNYQKTGHSLASTFHLDYLDFLAEDGRVGTANWHPIYEMLDDHRVGRFLKAQGYDILQFGSWWVGTFNSSFADENRPHGFSEFAMLYLRRTILRPVFHALPDTALTMRLDWDNAQCQRVAPQVEEIKAIGERDRPVYVFAHILVPHGPYNFAADGRCLTQAQAAARGGQQGYLDQIDYANLIIRDVVETLQSDQRAPPVILIQADEGPFPARDGRVPWQDATVDELGIKTGILNAYFFPDGDYRQLSQEITPVNSYRVLFNALFDTALPLLQDRTFAFPNDATLYDFHDVTARLRGDDDGPSTAGSETERMQIVQ
jgi:hypothetical protein